MLTLQPRRFRRQYGEQMLQLFTDQLRASGSRPRFWASTFKDLAVSVSCERLEDSMRSIFTIGLGGAVLATFGATGILMGRRPGGPNLVAMSIGVVVMAILGSAYMIRRLAQTPSVTTGEVAGMASRPAIGLLRWAALPVAFVGLVFVFFGLAWGSAVHGGVAAGLLAGSALIWRAFSRNG
jgi:hypothetical protein